MKWYYSRVLRRMVKFKDWEIALRKRSGKGILDTKAEDKFVPVPNTDEYWFADPILFFYQGINWLFVEAFNKEKKRGEIGVFEIDENSSVRNYQTIISLDCHMSYPFVFKYGEEIYMIPESGEENRIYLYRALDFPYRWEQAGILCDGHAYRDSTVYFTGDQLYMLTYERTDDRRLFHSYDCHEFLINIEKCQATHIRTYTDKKAILRPAGLALQINDEIIRNSQKCDRIYGEALLFWELDKINSSWENAKFIKKVSGGDLKIKGRQAVLTHTYSCTEDYEVIDYRTVS